MKHQGIIFQLVNTKGGVGKSAMAVHFLPFFANENEGKVVIFELDSNNKQKIDSRTIEYKSLVVDDKDGKNEKEAYDEITLLDIIEEGTLKIIDAGGGNDTLAVIENSGKYIPEMKKIYIIPVLNDVDTLRNIEDTIFQIKKYEDNPCILLSLQVEMSSINNPEKVKETYNFLFENEKALSSLREIGLIFVPKADILKTIKDKYETSLYDVYNNFKDYNDSAYAKAKVDIINSLKKEYPEDVEKMKSESIKQLAKLRDLKDNIEDIKTISIYTIENIVPTIKKYISGFKNG